MLSIGLSILSLALVDAETTVADLPGAGDPPRMTSPYSIGLERVAPRILFERCRVEMVGDSETNHAGVTTDHAESRFHHGVLRTFRPRRWSGCFARVRAKAFAPAGFLSSTLKTKFWRR